MIPTKDDEQKFKNIDKFIIKNTLKKTFMQEIIVT